MASMIPVAGSAYTYAYATMGEVRIFPEYLFTVINSIHSLLLGSLVGI
jgi:amino acid transporter